MNSRDLNYWTEMIFRRRITVLEVCAVVFGLVVVVTLILPPSYQGSAKIFVRDNRASQALQRDRGAGNERSRLRARLARRWLSRNAQLAQS